jgi:hypothetical protein
MALKPWLLLKNEWRFFNERKQEQEKPELC